MRMCMTRLEHLPLDPGDRLLPRFARSSLVWSSASAVCTLQGCLIANLEPDAQLPDSPSVASHTSSNILGKIIRKRSTIRRGSGGEVYAQQSD